MATSNLISNISTASSSETKFQFPPIHSFPPFFTLQPNPSSLASQLSIWTSLVLAFSQHHRVFYLDADGQWERSGAGGLLENKLIDRRLSPESTRQLLAHMVKEGKAAYDPPPPRTRDAKSALPSRAMIFWRRPEEWGEMIYKWIMETGQNGSIMTFFELTEGDLSQDTDFASLPIPLLRKALEYLARTGRAQIFATEGGSEEGEGVKFS